jgi:hypothetical protein
MAEAEFDTLVAALGETLGDRVEVEDHSADHHLP